MASKPSGETRIGLEQGHVESVALPAVAGKERRNRVSVFSRLAQQAIGQKKEFGDSFDPAAHDYPSLWHWLTSTEAGDTHTKEPAKLSIRAAPGGFFASLSDDSFGVSIDASSEHLSGCFEALEKALDADQPAIRSWPNHEVKVKKKKEVK